MNTFNYLYISNARVTNNKKKKSKSKQQFNKGLLATIKVQKVREPKLRNV